MDEDAELGVFVPVGDFVFLQGLPVGAIGTLRADAARFFHERGALRIVFRTGVLPGLIDGFGVLGTAGLGLRGYGEHGKNYGEQEWKEPSRVRAGPAGCGHECSCSFLWT